MRSRGVVASRWSVRLSVLLLVASAFAPPARAGWPVDPRENLALCNQRVSQDEPVAIADGLGGIFVVWHTFPAAGQGDLWAQHVVADGSFAWDPEGVPVCTERDDQRGATVASDGAGGFIVVWRDRRNGRDWDLYAQRIGPDGATRWDRHGVPVSVEPGDQTAPLAVADGHGGVIVEWSDQRGGDVDLYAQAVDSAGALRWSASGLNAAGGTGAQSPAGIVGDAAGGALLVWLDTGVRETATPAPTDLDVQRLDADGNVRWEAGALRIASDVGAAPQTTCASDGAGGLLVAWDEDIVLAQRVDSTGAPVWGPDGVMVSDGPGLVPIVLPLEDGGAFVVWASGLTDGFPVVHARRVGADGIAQGGPEGFVMASGRRPKSQLAAVADGLGGLIIAGRDGRDTEFGNLRASRADSTGTLLWTKNGTLVSSATGFQRSLRLVADGTGGVIAIWVGNRGVLQRVYAQRVDARGNLGGTVGEALREGGE